MSGSQKKGTSKMDILDELKARGFVAQCTHEEDLRQALESGQVTYYIGFDPTAESLQLGNLVAIMSMAHLQRAGHRPIVILGGATAMIGDPSGKKETRRMMSQDEIQANAEKMLPQFRRFLKLDGENGLVLDNADWFKDKSLIEFLRDIGRHFRVNEMIKAEGYRQRLESESGLSFIEFSYQLMQAYDFLVLHDRYGCALQMGGNDQWGNITAGVDLVRRLRGKQTGGEVGAKQKSLVFGLTSDLILTASGGKMGKTEKGVVWLDPKKTSPYELYQYWINTDDRDVVGFLKLFTFLSLEEVVKFESLRGEGLRSAKEVLAFEATKLIHGEAEALKAKDAAKAAFGGGDVFSAEMPTTTIEKSAIQKGISVAELCERIGLARSRSEARRLIQQGGIYLNEEQVQSPDAVVGEGDLKDNSLILRRGKKQYRRVVIS